MSLTEINLPSAVILSTSVYAFDMSRSLCCLHTTTLSQKDDWFLSLFRPMQANFVKKNYFKFPRKFITQVLAITKIFTARCYASAVLAMALCPYVCVLVCVSVTSRSSTKTAKHMITQTTLHDSLGTLVFWCQRSPRKDRHIVSVKIE